MGTTVLGSEPRSRGQFNGPVSTRASSRTNESNCAQLRLFSNYDSTAYAFVGDWTGPQSAAQLSAHDVFQGLQVDLSNNHPCPCEGSIVTRGRHAQKRVRLQRIARNP